MGEMFHGWAGEDFAVIAALVLIAFVAHEPWRWAGLVIGRGISPDSDLFLWVRLVSSALVAALVVRIVVFPVGSLEEIALVARIGALVVGVGVFLGAGRNLAVGVIASALALGV